MGNIICTQTKDGEITINLNLTIKLDSSNGNLTVTEVVPSEKQKYEKHVFDENSSIIAFGKQV